MSTQYEMIYMKEDDDCRERKNNEEEKNNDDQLYCIKKYFDKNVKKMRKCVRDDKK